MADGSRAGEESQAPSQKRVAVRHLNPAKVSTNDADGGVAASSMNSASPQGHSVTSSGARVSTSSTVSRRDDAASSTSARPLIRVPSTFGGAPRWEKPPVDVLIASALQPLDVIKLHPTHSSSTFSKAERKTGEGVIVLPQSNPVGPGSYDVAPSAVESARGFRKAPSFGFGSSGRSTSLLMFPNGLAAEVGARNAQHSSGNERGVSPKRRATSATPRDVVLKKAPSAVFSSSRRFGASATDVPGPGSYFDESNEDKKTDAKEKDKKPEASVSDEVRPSNGEQTVANNAATVPSSDPLSSTTKSASIRARSAPPRRSSWVTSPGRRHNAIFTPNPEDATPGPGAYDSSTTRSRDSSITRRVQHPTIGQAKRDVCDPIPSRPSSPARARPSSSTTRPVLPECSLIRKSSNVYLRRSQDRWEQLHLSTRTITASRDASPNAMNQ